MSKRTLLNRLKQYGLTRRNCDINEAVLRQHISIELEGAGNLLGYRAMWRKLHLKYGINVPRSAVEILLREMDPEGTSRRVIWLKLEMSNNDPKVIGKLFRDAVIEVGGCPSILRTDRDSVGTIDYKHQYNPENLEEINRELNPSDDSNESLIYQEYFAYVNEMLGIAEPSSWRVALALYHRLSTVAQT
ncbi:Hypothetical predicted protein [Paramuricea clavata]|uniref:Uncharacterized protein n=1 Tax=Paramuricea clavata TaxID=317549 RepID=A0A7D9I6R8_PARCT|nr:Hypothetical predicted protein [Paramuricea clavata]